MKQIYLIQSALVSKNDNEQPSWEPVCCVESEEQAHRDCVRLQLRRDDEYSDFSCKFIYRYVKIKLF